MTIRNLISLIRSSVKEYSDDTLYSDEFLYNLFTTLKIETLSAMMQDKKFKDSVKHDFNFQEFCIKLLYATEHDCDCVPLGCKALKSEFTIPEYLVDSLKVSTLSDKTVSYIDSADYKYIIHHPIKSTALHYTVTNNKLIVYGSTSLKVVKLKAIWADPTDIIDAQYCSDTSDCITNPLDMKVGVTRNFINRVIYTMIESFKTFKNFRKDIINDTQTEIIYP